MASGRRGGVPIFRVTFDQLEARICERLILQGHGADTQETQSVKDSVSTSNCHLDVQNDCNEHDFQIKPITKTAEVMEATNRLPLVEFEDQRLVKRTANRGRGHRISPNCDQFRKLKISTRTSQNTSTRSTDDFNMPVSTNQSKGRGKTLATGSISKEELVRTWKSYASGKVERALCMSRHPSTWIEEPLSIVKEFQDFSEQLLLTNLEMASKLDVCYRLWKSGHYPIVDALRKHTAAFPKEWTDKLEFFLESTQTFYSLLLGKVQSEYVFQLSELVAGTMEFSSKTQLRMVMMAVSACHHCYLAMGDVERYKQQMAATPDWGKPRTFYLKAVELAPKDGRPYNQLAVIALNAHRRLDAFYFYMRSLMVKNSFKSAHDSLVGLFEDTSTKAKKQEEEEKRKSDRAEKAVAKRIKRARYKRKHHHTPQAKNKHEKVFPSGRRELWIMPGYEEGKKSIDTVGMFFGDEEDVGATHDIERSPSLELLKRLLLAFLVIHGKLFTKIGIETFDDTLHLLATLWVAMLDEQQLSLKDTTMFIKMMVINIFSLHHASENHSDSASGQHTYCCMGLALTLMLTSRHIKACLQTLENAKVTGQHMSTPITPMSAPITPVPTSHGEQGVSQDNSLLRCSLSDSLGGSTNECYVGGGFSTSEIRSPSSAVYPPVYPAHILPSLDQLCLLLPAVRVWFKWMLCQRELLTTWASAMDPSLLEEFLASTCSFLNESLFCFPGLKDKVVCSSDQCPGLWEDRLLAGFQPLGSSASLQDTFTIKDVSSLQTEEFRDQAVKRIAYIAHASLQLSYLTFDPTTALFSVVEITPKATLETTPTKYNSTTAECDLQNKVSEGEDSSTDSSSGDDIIVEGYSSEEIEEGKNEPEVESADASCGVSVGSIEQLKAQRETLTKNMEKHNMALETAKSVLIEAKRKSDFFVTITPKYLVPDTNCFVDMLSSIESLVRTTHYVVALPLIVLTELEGLSKGSAQEVPEKEKKRMVEVSAGAKSALDFIREKFSVKDVCFRALTTQGNMLTSLSFRAEVTGKASNDNLILDSCEQLHSKVDKDNRHSVVLLTDDRNLRVKAHTINLPVKNMPDFMKLSNLNQAI